MHIKVGTRGSKLALIQTNQVVDLLKEKYPEHTFENVIIHTTGDKNKKDSLNKIGGKGVFIKEIEEQLLKGEIQMAVHSMKDIPSILAPGLVLTKTLKREDARDVLILREKKSLDELEKGARIATGSIRRREQLLKLRNDLEIVDIRGNIDTRLRKMEENQYNGIVLAAAGLHRLQRQDCISYYFSEDELIPSPCQGALGIECREDQTEILEMVNSLYDVASDMETMAERTFLKEMMASCDYPIGAKAYYDGKIHMKAMFGKTKLYYAQVTGEDPIEVGKQAAREIRQQMAGIVSLVGAGPGDPELITMKGLQAIQQADCMIYDRLIPNELLNFASQDCECIYVGKTNHVHTMPQDQINALMVQKAMEYKNVVRLKGGDVFVFGRGTEEIQYLKEKGISHRVVSGISSSIAGPAAAGIPITSRHYANGFRVISAHNYKGELSNIDFHSIAHGSETCVFLMGLSKVNEIVDSLLKEGMDPKENIAIISNATLENQVACFSTLQNIREEMKQYNLVSPSLIVVGKTVGLHDEIYKEPVKKREIYIPKIGKEALPITKEFRTKDFKVYEVQVGEIEYKKFELDMIPDVLIFTSKNGIDGFFKSNPIDIRKFVNSKFVCVGQKSAKYLKTFGIQADFVPSKYNGQAIVDELKIEKNQIVYFFGANSDSDVEKLSDKCQFKKYVVYENNPVDVPNIKILDTAQVIFSCTSNAKRFIGALENKEDWIEKGTAFSIGSSTTKALKEIGVKRIIEAKKPSYSVILEEVINHGKMDN